jgi:hypothetical protein
MLFLSLIVGFTKWRHISRWWPIPALVSLAFLFSIRLTAPIGRYISDWRFERDLALFSGVVGGIRNGTIPVVIPPNYRYGKIEVENKPAYIGNIGGAHCDDSGILVIFYSKFHA